MLEFKKRDVMNDHSEISAHISNNLSRGIIGLRLNNEKGLDGACLEPISLFYFKKCDIPHQD
jgi:hypothetical protein